MSLPKGWKVEKLGDVCERIFAGGDVPKGNLSKEKTTKFTVPIYSNGKKNDGLYGYTDIEKVKVDSISISARGTIGYTSLRKAPFFPVVRLVVVVPNSKSQDLEYLYYFIHQQEFTNSGTSIPQLTVPMVKEYDFSYPPLAEQKKIVAILDKAFAAIDEAKGNTEQNIVNAKEIFQSRLDEIFSNPKKGWKIEKLGDVVRIIGGGTPSKKNKDFYNGNIPWATVRDMKQDELSKTEYKITKIGLDSSSSNLISKGEIIVATRVGLGKSCLLKQDTAINQDLKALIPIKLTLFRLFLHYWYKSIASKVENDGRGMTVKGVNLVYVKNLNIPIPPLAEQKKIVAELDKLRAATDEMVENYEQKLEDLEELRKSMLERAFLGELT